MGVLTCFISATGKGSWSRCVGREMKPHTCALITKAAMERTVSRNESTKCRRKADVYSLYTGTR